MLRFPGGYDDVIKWKHFPRYWPFVQGIHRSPVSSPHKGQWRRAFKFSLICSWINGWVNNGEAGKLRRHRARYDVIVMDWCVRTTVPIAKPKYMIFILWILHSLTGKTYGLLYPCSVIEVMDFQRCRHNSLMEMVSKHWPITRCPHYPACEPHKQRGVYRPYSKVHYYGRHGDHVLADTALTDCFSG